ncbi:MAG: DUF4126 domain-containing protein [Acidimicrobiales bacterium]
MFPTGLLAGSGWSSGLNLWAVIGLLGIAGRAGWADTPEMLQKPFVIAAAVVLYAAEFVIDKIPYLDSAWDVANTAIRPTGAGALALLMTPHESTPHRVVAVAGAATAALTSHSAKASLRALINVSPEPVSNIIASLTEDGLAFALVGFAFAHPRVTLVITIAAAIGCVVFVWWALRTLHRIGRRLLGRRMSGRGPTRPPRRTRIV